MNDYLKSFESYKSIKEIDDLHEEIKKLRGYYFSGRYDMMQQYIQSLMLKYPAETLAWNSTHSVPCQTPEQSYRSAEAFLQTRYQAMLLQKGKKDNYPNHFPLNKR